MNTSPNREKVLLNLKWFVSRLLKTFESKLIQSVSRSSNSLVWESPNSSPASSPVSYTPKHNTNINHPTGELPLLRQLLDEELRRGRHKAPSVDYLSQSESPRKKNILHGVERSPLMRIRSLTNSPLFRRLSLSGQHKQKNSLLSPNAFHDYGGNNDPDEQNGTINGEACNIPAHSKGLCLSNPQTPIDSNNRHSNFMPKSFLRWFYESCSENERIKWLSAFAQQLCIIYEYQLGMLRGLTSIHAAADYVAEFILKAIKLGKLKALTSEELAPSILFDSSCRPSSYSKCIKTCPLAVTGEQLTWRLGEMWTLPGIRHNEVGGENCHNLSIVTHFLSAATTSGDPSRSDIYGYRNLLLVIKRQPETETPANEVQVQKNDSQPDISIPSATSQFYFDMSYADYLTITTSKVKAGTRDDSLISSDTNPGSSSSESATNINSVQKPSPSPDLTSHHPRSRRILATSGTSTIRQHLHRAYRPVFFVIFNKPSVIDHLTECDSFAAFCKRQSLSPVMFLNQPTKIFDNRPYPCIYQNFDLFSVTVAGYSMNSSDIQTVPFTDVAERQPAYPLQYNLLNCNKTPIMAFPYITQHNVAAYDNPGFAR